MQTNLRIPITVVVVLIRYAALARILMASAAATKVRAVVMTVLVGLFAQCQLAINPEAETSETLTTSITSDLAITFSFSMAITSRLRLGISQDQLLVEIHLLRIS